MSLSTLPLSYCTNVHPAQSVAEVVDGLRTYTVAVRERLGEPIAAGLWLSEAVIRELTAAPKQIEHLATVLGEGSLICYTLNAFPFGNFHSERVKEQVYLPDWTTDERRTYTEQCAHVLAQLLPDGTEGSISTVPLGYKRLSTSRDFVERCQRQLLDLARQLDDLHDDTGRVIRLAIEPEPLCVLETTPEAVSFFERLYDAAEKAGLLDVAQRHLGLCYDVCHQAVEFEDTQASIESLRAADIRINKVHITCAIQLRDPKENPELREAISHFVEPRYMHQTFVRKSSGEVFSMDDLTQEFCLTPPPEALEADMWRVHYHVPVDRSAFADIESTREELERALTAVAALDYAPHLEVETYTWGVLPSGERPDLVSGLTGELSATRELLATIANATK